MGSSNTSSHIDLSIYHLLSRFTGNWVLDRVVDHQQSSALFKGVPFLAAYWYFWFHSGSDQEKRRRAIIAIFVGTLLAIVAAKLLGSFAPFRLRPEYVPNLEHHLSFPTPKGLESWNSFPSDTAAYFCALAFGLTYLSRRFTIAISLYTAVWICLPRMYLGLHYASDIAAGAAIGVAAVWAVLKADWQHSRLSARVLAFMNANPPLFYGAAFLITFEMANTFEDIRALVSGLVHLAARMGPYGKMFGFPREAFAALLLMAVTAACIGFLYMSRRAPARAAPRSYYLRR